ncbi:MAG: DUF3570 domain-containing protein [Gammaproteobacteria bacterium]|nr:DUF3570 domain-containing protein [Gammaproteobacteria bacterium]
MKNKNSFLLALTSSALVLPAYQSQAATAPERSKFSYQFSSYQEDNTEASKTFGGESERYKIDVHQFKLLKPINDEYVVTLDLQTESLSGASPWFTELNNAGQPQLVMSGASISESRTDFNASIRRYDTNNEMGLSISNSSENDYTSTAFGFDGVYELENKHTTINAGFGISNDELTPTQKLIPTSVTYAEKDTSSWFVGVGQVINPNMVGQVGLSFTKHSGYLTDPYKKNDARPNERVMWALNGGIRYYVEDYDAALHADYRFFTDDWGIDSHTITVSWYQPIFENYDLVPTIRYYSQSEADFFSNSVDFNQTYYADDFRLSAYSAIETGLKLKQTFNDWAWSASVNYYQSQEETNSSPGLVNFFRYSLAIEYSWD